jgi:hypothetical protein
MRRKIITFRLSLAFDIILKSTFLRNHPKLLLISRLSDRTMRFKYALQSRFVLTIFTVLIAILTQEYLNHNEWHLSK